MPSVDVNNTMKTICKKLDQSNTLTNSSLALSTNAVTNGSDANDTVPNNKGDNHINVTNNSLVPYKFCLQLKKSIIQ